MSTGDMGRFWDERAREDAFYFVDNRLDYRDADVERFWREGDDDLDAHARRASARRSSAGRRRASTSAAASGG